MSALPILHNSFSLITFVALFATLSKAFVSKDYDFCQSNTRFLVVRDADHLGTGFSHKLDDFLSASQMAVKLNWTLVGFVPSVHGRHSIDQNGKPTEMSEFKFSMHFADIIDTKSLIYSVRDRRGKSSKCQLRHLSVHKESVMLEQKSIDIVTIDFGLRRFVESRNDALLAYRFWELGLRNSHVAKRNIFSKQGYNSVSSAFNGVKFSKFFRSAALNIRRSCLDKSDKMNRSMWKFFLIHLRGTDKPCLQKLFTPRNLVERIKSFDLRVKNQSVIYLMTNMIHNSTYVKELKNYYGKNLCTSEDVQLFGKEPFLDNGYYMYIAELAAMQLADGYVASDYDHRKARGGRVMGTIVDRRMKKLC